MTQLDQVVTVSRRFQRSVRIDSDLGVAGALQGYVCHASSRMAVETMARLFKETGQRAFTWTGPYGGGKSSLALLLAEVLGGNTQQNQLGLEILGSVDGFHEAFPQEEEPWLVIPLVGRRADPVQDMRDALVQAVAREDRPARTRKRQEDPTGRDVLDRLSKEAASRPRAGVVLIIDELGKYLEAAANGEADIHFFQELAEAAARSEGRLLIIGILHQSFDQYVRRFGSEIQEDWAKIQGRFVDIPIVTATDEVLDLIGHALEVTDPSLSNTAIADGVATAIRRRRPGSPDDLEQRLQACWPLHPVTASLIGPLSRRRFGQNERSVFGFLNSSEPYGFQEFLRTHGAEDGLYGPAQLWDYLQANLEPAILASPDAHRWASAVDALQRAERQGEPLHLQLIKSIAVIELFNGGSGVMPERSILLSCVPGTKPDRLDEALQELKAWSVITHRSHLDAFALFAGSDFDLAEAVAEASAHGGELSLEALSDVAGLQPILAKKHYFQTGTLRWFTPSLASSQVLPKQVERFDPSGGASGQFMLVIPSVEASHENLSELCAEASRRAGLYPVAVGLPPNADLIRLIGTEYQTLRSINRSHPALEGDAVARRELEARLTVVSAELEEALWSGFLQASWYIRGQVHAAGSSQAVASLATRLADETFPDSPHIRSELVNREQPSSNSQAAVRALLHAMVNVPGEDGLGINGYPAEMGLYCTVLKSLRLHKETNDGFGFHPPSGKAGQTLLPMWRAAEKQTREAEGAVQLQDIYQLWRQPPFGIRSGLLPVLATAFILANHSTMAVYVEGVFQPEINDHVVDLLLQDASVISLRYVDPKTDGKLLLEALRDELSDITGRQAKANPLGIGQALVEFVMRLPEWTRRTSSVSQPAQKLRLLLLKASDPYRTIFVDLAALSASTAPNDMAHDIGALLRELDAAYQAMLDGLQAKMMDALAHRNRDLDELRLRAETVQGISGNLRLDAFASRLQNFTGSVADMEALAGLLANKPPRNWSDLEPNKAALEAAHLALEFRQAEMLAQVQGRAPTRHALGIVVGTGEQGASALRSVELSGKEMSAAKAIASSLQEVLAAAGVSEEVALAALAEAGLLRMAVDDDEQRTQTG